MKKIRLLLADDHPLICTGIRSALAEDPNLILVGEAANGLEVQQLCVNLQPDVLLLDLSMPGPKAEETITFLRQQSPLTKIIILTAYPNEVYIHRLIPLGIKGYILKDEAIEALVRAVYTIEAGDTWFSNQVIQILSAPDKKQERGYDHTDSEATSLSSQETVIMQYLAEGLSNEQIAERVCISKRTVRHYVEQIMRKLSAPNRTKAVLLALQKGWVKL